jgi:signal transduction histidine kinase
VSDAGPGVAPSDRERIFEKFTRLVDHLTQTAGGTGLGLYISRRLVEGMGGTISVGPSSEGGAAFRFTLPAAPGRRANNGNDNGVRRHPAAVEPPETITLP